MGINDDKSFTIDDAPPFKANAADEVFRLVKMGRLDEAERLISQVFETPDESTNTIIGPRGRRVLEFLKRPKKSTN